MQRTAPGRFAAALRGCLGIGVTVHARLTERSLILGR
jgi:hypothetical protein